MRSECVVEMRTLNRRPHARNYDAIASLNTADVSGQSILGAIDQNVSEMTQLLNSLTLGVNGCVPLRMNSYSGILFGAKRLGRGIGRPHAHSFDCSARAISQSVVIQLPVARALQPALRQCMARDPCSINHRDQHVDSLPGRLTGSLIPKLAPTVFICAVSLNMRGPVPISKFVDRRSEDFRLPLIPSAPC